MLLQIDIGNTQTVIGIYDEILGKSSSGDSHEKGYVAKWRIATGKHDSVDDLITRLLPLFQLSDIDINRIDKAAFSCVVPALSLSWDHAIRKVFDIAPMQCTAELALKSGLFEADYPNASEIGADRIADAIAAKAEFGAPVIIVDFGTATNIEVINDKGIFIGGVIAPGILTGANALFQNASQIAGTDFVAPDHVIGKSTTEAVRSGIIYGEVGRVDGLLERIFAEVGQKCEVVATGGLVHSVSKLSKHITAIRPELTLDGLRLLMDAI